MSKSTPGPDFDLGAVEPDGLERTAIHDVLSNERRVIILELIREEREYDLSDLAEEVAAVETGQRPPPRDKRQSVYVTLDQTHLPKLDELDIVDYDSQRKRVALRPEAASLFEDDAAGDAGGPTANAAWLDGAIAVSAGGLALTAVLEAGLAPVPVPAAYVAAFAFLVLLVLLVYHKGRAAA